MEINGFSVGILESRYFGSYRRLDARCDTSFEMFKVGNGVIGNVHSELMFLIRLSSE